MKKKFVHLLVSNTEALELFYYADSMKEYILRESNSNREEDLSRLRDVVERVRKAHTKHSRIGYDVTCGFPVKLDFDGVIVFYETFRYTLDRELLRAGETNEPLAFMGEEAYGALSEFALRLAGNDMSITKIGYEVPCPLFQEED